MVFKTEKRFIRYAVALWLLCITIDVAVLSGVAYVVFHFICKFW